MTNPATEFDSPWKEILESYFEDFMAFFFPAIHPQIDWSIPPEFLEQELRQIVQDASLGKRLLDKLVKIYLADGRETWVLVHIEIQAQPQLSFAQRMLTYYYRIFDRYNVPGC